LLRIYYALRSDPYFYIERGSKKLYTSNIVKIDLNPKWNPVTQLSVKELCYNDFDRPIKFTVYDWDRFTSHDLIGSFTVTFRELEQVCRTRQKLSKPVVNETYIAKNKANYVSSGMFHFDRIEIDEEEVTQPNPDHGLKDAVMVYVYAQQKQSWHKQKQSKKTKTNKQTIKQECIFSDNIELVWQRQALIENDIVDAGDVVLGWLGNFSGQNF